MFVPMKEIVDRAYVGGYAVPALPSQNEVQIRATIEAAAATNSPLHFFDGQSGRCDVQSLYGKAFCGRSGYSGGALPGSQPFF